VDGENFVLDIVNMSKVSDHMSKSEEASSPNLATDTYNLASPKIGTEDFLHSIGTFWSGKSAVDSKLPLSTVRESTSLYSDTNL
jgi:hypothetical protein